MRGAEAPEKAIGFLALLICGLGLVELEDWWVGVGGGGVGMLKPSAVFWHQRGSNQVTSPRAQLVYEYTIGALVIE